MRDTLSFTIELKNKLSQKEFKEFEDKHNFAGYKYGKDFILMLYKEYPRLYQELFDAYESHFWELYYAKNDRARNFVLSSLVK